ncbi:MAG: hypothetical protein U0905_11010 [Pirellulales bacterium]
MTSIFATPVMDRSYGRSMKDLFNDPKTIFHRIKQTELDGVPAVEVAIEFPVRFHEGQGSTGAIREVRVKIRYFVHQENYLVLAWTQSIDEKPIDYYRNMRVYYDENYSAIRKIVETNAKSPGLSNEVAWSQEMEVTSFQPMKLATDEFYLSHYGLPEPGKELQQRSWWPLAMSGAGLALIAAFLFRSWRR